MKLFKFFAAKPFDEAAHRIYLKVVEQSRRPGFYIYCNVPDTADGRFDMIALHAFLILRRCKRDGDKAAELAQALFDLMFEDMDQNLREMGVGDLSVGKRIKGMAEAFYGRIAAYEAGLDADDSVLREALLRNLYRKTAPESAQVAAIADYMRRESARLDAADITGLMAGRLQFGPAPSEPPEVSP